MAVYSLGKQFFTFFYFIGTIICVILLLAAASGGPYSISLGIVGGAGLFGGSFNFVYQTRFKYASYDAISLWKRGSPDNPGAIVSDYDIQVVRTHIPYDPIMFGRLETEYQVQTAEKIRQGQLHAELIEYEGNNDS
jgi:hypothetical protein